jgi:hypothetical protein
MPEHCVKAITRWDKHVCEELRPTPNAADYVVKAISVESPAFLFFDPLSSKEPPSCECLIKLV